MKQKTTTGTKRLLKIVKYFFKILLILVTPIVLYLVIALVCAVITTQPKVDTCKKTQHIYVVTNGLHLDVVLKNAEFSESLIQKLKGFSASKYVAFGWGDKGFYLNTPTWSELEFRVLMTALFLQSESAMHVTSYNQIRAGFIKVDLCEHQLEKLVQFIHDSFDTNANNEFLEIANSGYSRFDTFYEAKGSYNFIQTCNEWVNDGLKTAKVKTAIWSPFDKSIIYQMKKAK